MKKSGNSCDFKSQRDSELLGIFRRVAADPNVQSSTDLYRTLVNCGMSRFYVSQERALNVVSAIIDGKDPLSSMRPTKQRMFREIAARVLDARARSPRAPLCKLVNDAIFSPAPELYMTPAHARFLISAIRGKNLLPYGA